MALAGGFFRQNFNREIPTFSALEPERAVRLDVVVTRTDTLSPVNLDDLWVDLTRRPFEYLVRRWNWKAGVISGILRGGIFFTGQPTRRARHGVRSPVRGILLSNSLFRRHWVAD